MAAPFSPRQKKLLLLVGAGLAALAIVGLLIFRGVDVPGQLNRGFVLLGAGGPWVFFAAMALLPGAGVPMSIFTLTAGRLFEERMGMTSVVIAGIAAATVNIVITYWLARWALRPGLTRLLGRLGYALPKFDSADQTDLIVVLRVTPGIPLFVQNYLLGLADAPIGRYLVISCAVQWGYTAGFIMFGDALFKGKGRLACAAVGLLVASIALTHFVRRHQAGRKAAA